MMLLFVACVADPALDLVGDVQSGAATYDLECAACHGAAGEGTGRGPELVAPDDDASADNALDVIRLGRGAMPAFSLDDQALADLLAWMRR